MSAKVSGTFLQLSRLDPYLKRFENYAASQRLKAEYERRMDLTCEQMANRRNDNEIFEQEKEIYSQQCQ